MTQCTEAVLTDTEGYIYVIKGRHENIALNVDERDVILNADGEVDCPLDVVLRKNNYSFDDLNEWQAHEIIFIRVNGDETETLNTISLNMNL